MDTLNLKGLPLEQLEAFIASIGEPKYRAQQIFSWLYRYRVRSFDEMNNLSVALRTRLQEVAFIEQITIASKQVSAIDGTIKFLFELSDGARIETVLIPPRATAVDADERFTICLSTQVGCPLDCAFCATASMGFTRNLTVSEIISQIFSAQAETDKPITNAVFMGMGEPMLNYDNVMTAVDLMSADFGLGMSARRITISTAGYAQHIRRMADEGRKPKLALSLHSMKSSTRTELMPITKKFDVHELMDALEYYHKKTKKGVMLEYILFEGVNDTDADIALLVKASRRFECRVNLIPFHAITPRGANVPLRGASKQAIEIFAGKLRSANVPTFVRYSAGVDIDAACGQLAVKNLETTTQHSSHIIFENN